MSSEILWSLLPQRGTEDEKRKGDRMRWIKVSKRQHWEGKRKDTGKGIQRRVQEED